MVPLDGAVYVLEEVNLAELFCCCSSDVGGKAKEFWNAKGNTLRGLFDSLQGVWGLPNEQL